LLRLRETLDRHRAAAAVALLLLSAAILPAGPMGARARLSRAYAPLGLLADDGAAPAAPGDAGRIAALEAEAAALRGENERLRALAGLDLARTGRPARPVEARVLARDRNWPLRRAVLVDRGRAHGLRTGLPVVTGRCLAGFVAECDETTALLVLLDDPASRAGDVRVRAGVQVWRPGQAAAIAEGVLAGERRGVLRVRMLPAGTVRPGDLVATSPADPLVPPGLVVGRIESVEDDARLGVATARVVPVEDPGGLERFVVLVVPEAAPGGGR
jgi:rod shape-determining protein MreC